VAERPKELADVERPPARPSRWRRAARLTRKLLLWAAALAIAAVAIPAATKQWTDRQQGLELKRDLVSDIGESSYDAFSRARAIAYLPSAQTTPRRLDALSAWVHDEGRIDGTFRTYLPGIGRNDWAAFRDALFYYVRLSCCENRVQRHRDIGLVRSFVDREKLDDGIQWDVVERGQAAVPRSNPTLYADAYDHLGRRVLLGSPFLAIRRANLEGLSSGWRDFAHDVVPGW